MYIIELNITGTWTALGEYATREDAERAAQFWELGAPAPGCVRIVDTAKR